jgi:hypothetical protein
MSKTKASNRFNGSEKFRIKVGVGFPKIRSVVALQTWAQHAEELFVVYCGSNKLSISIAGVEVSPKAVSIGALWARERGHCKGDIANACI